MQVFLFKNTESPDICSVLVTTNYGELLSCGTTTHPINRDFGKVILADWHFYVLVTLHRKEISPDFLPDESMGYRGWIR